MNEILNIPNDVYDYEFMVIAPNGKGDYEWVANFAFWNNDAQKLVEENQDKGYTICHNVRIAHKQLKPFARLNAKYEGR